MRKIGINAHKLQNVNKLKKGKNDTEGQIVIYGKKSNNRKLANMGKSLKNSVNDIYAFLPISQMFYDWITYMIPISIGFVL